jgi:ligand-binding sensor domain-containing protein/AraC-like DNA-binding protein
LKSRQFILEEWHKEAGLPRNTILDITQTSDGYLWIGTTEGLVRYDGLNFKSFKLDDLSQMISNRITCLHPSQDGSLWIGTEGGGIFLYRGGTFKQYTTNDGLASDYIKVIFQDSRGRIWIGTPDNYLNLFHKGIFKHFDSDDGLGNEIINTIYEDDTGSLFIGTHRGLFKMTNSSFQKITGPNDIFESSIISTIHKDSSGFLWIGTDQGLFMLNSSGLSKADTLLQAAFPGLYPNAIQDDHWGNIWVGTKEDLSIIYKNDKGDFVVDKIIKKTSISSLKEDHEYSIWAGTYGDGLKKFRPKKFDTYSLKDGLSNPVPLSLYEDQTGKLWVGLNNGQINILEKNASKLKKFNVFPQLQKSSYQEIRAICHDQAGNIWIASYGNGLYQIDRMRKLHHYTEEDGLCNNLVRTLFVHSSGSLWIGTRHGISVRRDGKFLSYSTDQGLPSDIILCFAEDREGRIWVGTGKGTAYLRGDHFETFTLGSSLDNHPVLSILADKEGDIWIGTEGGGLILIRNNSVTVITTDNGLPSNLICNILEDDNHHIWIATDNGIAMIPRAKIDDICKGTKRTFTLNHYTSQDGLPSDECIKYSQYSALKRKDGTLWFCLVNGISMINPESMLINKIPPPVHIEKIIVDDKPINFFSSNTKISLPKGNLTITFTALSFIAPYKMKFRYKLENHDSSWREIQPGESRKVKYQNLKPGWYTFKVTACNSDGIWNTKGDTISFQIKRPFIFSAYFWLIIGLIISGLGGLLYLAYSRELFIFSPKKYKTSPLSGEKKQEYLQDIINALEKRKMYREENLTLDRFSKELSIPRHYISQVVNEKLNKNFNDLINSYRINEAKEKLKHSVKSKASILEIAYEVGFNSKSAFNRAFKKHTGLTPSQFRNQLREKEK